MTKILKTIAISFGIIWILIITMWLALSAVVILEKDDIGRYLVLYVNKIQSGDLNIEKVSISAFRQFPRISINLENVTYYEHHSTQRIESEQPIARIENFYFGLELLKLLNGDISFNKIDINNGEMLFVIYPDSSLNLMNALKKDSTLTLKKSTDSKKTKTSTNDVSILIEKLILSDLRVRITNDPGKRKSSILIKNFESEIDYRDNQVNINFVTTMVIDTFKINESNSIRNQEISLDITSLLNKEKGIEIDKGIIDFAGSKFHLNGFFNPADDGDISLKVVSDGSLNILSIFIKDEIVKKVKKGDFYFFGFVEGKTFSEFPLINIDFGFKDVELVNPITNRIIKKLNLKGSFNSGRNKNLSEAILKVDTLYADFPDGKINLAGSLNNFAKPFFSINLFLDADVTGWDDVFKLGSIDSLNGRITIKDKTEGKYDASKKSIISNINLSEISFENFGFIIPGTIRFDKVNGKIFGNGDMFSLKDINIISESTDLNINGEIDNLQYLIFNIEKEIKAHLAIKSSVFDLPNFLAFDPSIKRDFPHRILDLDLIVDASTTSSKALNFKSFPEISFNIKKLKATTEEFLPTIDISSGIFKVSETVLGFHLDFDHFKTEFLDGRFDINGTYNSSSYQPFYIKTEIEMDGINISKLIGEDEDSVSEFYNGKMYGSLFLELEFASDTTEITLLNINRGNVTYLIGEDTLQTKSLIFNSGGIDYDLDKNPNPLATLFAKGNFKADEVKTPEFIANKIDFNFSVQNGEYEVATKKPKLFGISSKGEIKYTLKPFIETPSYHVFCQLSRFNIKEMLYTFLDDTVFSGDLSLSMDISMQGKELDELLASMNGEINLAGKNLIFYGVDADKMIEEFQRSQNFNLVDAGAVLLAGPIGLAVTKGSDFAKILITNPGQSSHISQLVSNWNAKDGLLTLKDVALSTKKNRVAAKGWLNIVKDSLDVSFAVIDGKGCSIFQQDVYGDLNKPTLGKVKVVGTLLAPVTNLYKDIMDVNCEAFYNGSLLQKQK